MKAVNIWILFTKVNSKLWKNIFSKVSWRSILLFCENLAHVTNYRIKENSSSNCVAKKWNTSLLQRIAQTTIKFSFVRQLLLHCKWDWKNAVTKWSTLSFPPNSAGWKCLIALVDLLRSYAKIGTSVEEIRSIYIPDRIVRSSDDVPFIFTPRRRLLLNFY